MTQQDTSVLQLRQERLRANMHEDEPHKNVDLQRKLDERNRLLGEYKVRMYISLEIISI